MNLSKSSYNNGFADLFSQICKISIYCIQIISTHENGEEKKRCIPPKGWNVCHRLPARKTLFFQWDKDYTQKRNAGFLYALFSQGRRSKTPSSNV